MKYKISGERCEADCKIDIKRVAFKGIVTPFDDLPPSNLEVLGVPFSGPLAGRDKDGEAFTKNTDF